MAAKPAKKTRVATTKRQLTFTVLINWQLGVAAAAEGMTISQYIAKQLKEPLKHVDYPAMPARIKRLCVVEEIDDPAAQAIREGDTASTLPIGETLHPSPALEGAPAPEQGRGHPRARRTAG